MTYTLWGTAHSLYTGKIRSYLIKKGVAYRERYPSDPDFSARILPAVGHFVAPVLETPEGEIVQDTGDMIDLLEARLSAPQLEPGGAVQGLVSLLFDAYGSEYLLPLAMHYRWTYREEQEAFLQAEFGRAMSAGTGRTERREAAAQTMAFFSGFLPNLGVLPDVIPAMEASFLELIDALDEHFQYHPYLLGGRPCRGDFGMMAPLFAHLGRDPVPAGLMKQAAPNLFRWTERMNLAAISDGEYPAYGEAYAENDNLPETLMAVLKIMFADWTPGLLADAACFNDWAKGKAPGTLVSLNGSKQVHPNVGPVAYDWRGVTMRRGSQPHMLWMFTRAQRYLASLADVDAVRAQAMLERTGGLDILAAPVERTMKRDDNLLVLA